MVWRKNMSAKNYFVCGNTAKGFSNLFSTNLQPLSKIYILKGGPGIGQLPLLTKIADELEQIPYDIEYIHSSQDPDAYDGIIIPELGIGIVDGTSPHVIEPTASGAREEYINLGMCWDTDKLKAHTTMILTLQDNIQQAYEKAYSEFAKALKVHDEWEKIYIGNMDFTKANKLTEDVIYLLLGSTKLEKPSCVKHRFFGGSTYRGPMDYVENITENIASRFFIKGRPGSGKSTMLKKILSNASQRGIDVEVYHCGFDPDSLDMLLFPELNLCIFDSTAPHEYYPSREGDSVIDMYAELIKEGTDEQYATELEDIVARYKSFNKDGTAYLSLAKHYQDELVKLYLESTDFDKLERIYQELLQELFQKVLAYK